MRMTSKDRAAALALLCDFINTASVNGTEGEWVFAEKIAATLRASGLEAELEVLDEKRANVFLRIAGKDRSRSILLNGHLDTVKYGDLQAWKTDPAVATIVDGRLYARGACDMKGGLAGIVYTLTSLREQGFVPAVDICFIASCDEESGGAGASACLDKACLAEAEFMLVAEPTALNLGICEKACNWLKLIVYGKTGHGAYPERGCNAIEHGFALLQRVKSQLVQHGHPLLGQTSMQITQINGGIVPNMTPDKAEFVMDIRNVPSISNEALFALIEKESQKEAESCQGLLRTELEIINSRPPLESSVTDPWIQTFAKAAQHIKGQIPEVCGVNFFTDASLFVQANDKAPLLLFGPGDPAMCHQANEALDIAEYEAFIEILTQFLKNIA